MKLRSYSLLFLLTFFANLLFSTPTIESEQPNLKILSWNIYMLPYLSLFNNNSTRAKHIVEELRYSDYQVIVFQEAFSSKCRNILAAGLKEKFPYQYGPANRCIMPMRTNSGLWVVSKFPLRKISEIVFRQSTGFDMIARKGAVLFEGEYQQRKIQIVATHLQADNPSKIRQKQCREISEKLLKPYNLANVPQFICGDFNTDIDDSRNYNNMLIALDARNGGLSGSVNATYDEIDNSLAKTNNGRKRIIDYVLVRNEQVIDSIERRVNPFILQIGQKSTFLSDHYGVEVSIRFKRVEELTSYVRNGR